MNKNMKGIRPGMPAVLALLLLTAAGLGQAATTLPSCDGQCPSLGPSLRNILCVPKQIMFRYL